MNSSLTPALALTRHRLKMVPEVSPDLNCCHTWGETGVTGRDATRSHMVPLMNRLKSDGRSYDGWFLTKINSFSLVRTLQAYSSASLFAAVFAICLIVLAAWLLFANSVLGL